MRTQQVGDSLVIAAEGDIDGHSGARFVRALRTAGREAPGGGLVLDLRRVGLVDAAGWAALLEANRELLRGGRRLRVLLGGGSQPLRSFTFRWLHVVLPRVDSLEELAGRP